MGKPNERRNDLPKSPSPLGLCRHRHTGYNMSNPPKVDALYPHNRNGYNLTTYPDRKDTPLSPYHCRMAKICYLILVPKFDYNYCDPHRPHVVLGKGNTELERQPRCSPVSGIRELVWPWTNCLTNRVCISGEWCKRLDHSCRGRDDLVKMATLDVEKRITINMCYESSTVLLNALLSPVARIPTQAPPVLTNHAKSATKGAKK
jgi:hypothetical protein